MFPLHDENPTELTPYVTLLIITVNILVWGYIEGAGFSEETLYGAICDFGLIPAEVTGRTAGFEGIGLTNDVSCLFRSSNLTSLSTNTFLHAGWLHLVGNMWFLWVFGNNIEDSMGHLRFLIFYLLSGVLASLAHIIAAPDSMIPTVGASGSVSAVMGAYLLLYPRVRVKTFLFIKIFDLPAWAVLIQWFTVQILYWLTSSSGQIAVWAHIGGFIVGLGLIRLFVNRRLIEAHSGVGESLGPDNTEWASRFGAEG